ncbi:glycoside hydrolase 100 family protein [Endothiovibrio diazotrophicus]
MSNENPISAAHRLLEASIIHYRGEPVGTIAARDPNAPAENYEECFVRDFVPSALVFLLDGRYEIVRNFLHLVLNLRSQQPEEAGHVLAPGVMPASFKVIRHDDGSESLRADFGDRAIGRVAPVDSMMWWLILLKAYVNVSGDCALADKAEFQRGIRQIMELCLRDGWEVFPTLLVPDGACMIDRRMGIYGHPLEIQSLFFAALGAARQLITDTPEHFALRRRILDRMRALYNYVRIYYWLDLERLNEIHRFRTEELGYEGTVANALNIYPESIPSWVVEWLPDDGGYLVGNLGPGRIDFRFFALGNLLAVLFDLTTEEESEQLMNLFAARWDDLMGNMPVKICYPAMEGHEWLLLTGSDPKNAPWSYHNGGNWPALLWVFVGAALEAGHFDLAERAFLQARDRLAIECWPEYYDGRGGRLIGRRANHHQSWSATALILADRFLREPDRLRSLGFFTELSFHHHEHGQEEKR